jgi:putative tryptophan/tyrosine transport system substrate-binding protein
MRRREFISVIVGATAWPLAGRAQQPAMPVIGFLTEVPEALFGQPQLLAFRQGLGELGWVERKKVRQHRCRT